MAKDFKPFVEVELEVLFGGRAEEAATPAAAATVGDGTADCTARGEEEEIDVWIDLRDDAEVDVEVCVEGL